MIFVILIFFVMGLRNALVGKTGHLLKRFTKFCLHVSAGYATFAKTIY
jgi:hypothetical protein